MKDVTQCLIDDYTYTYIGLHDNQDPGQAFSLFICFICFFKFFLVGGGRQQELGSLENPLPLNNLKT